LPPQGGPRAALPSRRRADARRGRLARPLPRVLAHAPGLARRPLRSDQGAAMTDAAQDQRELRMTKVIDAPREDVFRARTGPEILKRWWGPGEFTCPRAEVDLRPGGSYLLLMQPTEGDPLHLAGTYREVEPPERLVYTWRWEVGVPDPGESLVTVEFR